MKLDTVFSVLDDLCRGRATPFQWTGGMTGHSTSLTLRWGTTLFTRYGPLHFHSGDWGRSHHHFHHHTGNVAKLHSCKLQRCKLQSWKQYCERKVWLSYASTHRQTHRWAFWVAVTTKDNLLHLQIRTIFNNCGRICTLFNKFEQLYTDNLDIEIEFELTLLTYKVFSCKDVRSKFLGVRLLAFQSNTQSRSWNGHPSNH